MNKNGFTLMELLVVISILVVVSVSSTLVFNSASTSSEEEDLKRTYQSIQRTAEVYLDLNDSWLNSFNEKGEVYLKVSELLNANYYNAKYADIKSDTEISSNYFVKVFISKINNLPYVNSCLIAYDHKDKPYCVADRDGNSDNCNYDTMCK